MSQRSIDPSEERILILAPTPTDSAYTRAVLHSAGIEGAICANLPSVLSEMSIGAGVVLVAEEALIEGLEQLASALDKQPTWSDLPILLITQHGADSPRSIQAVEMLGNVTLVERPIRVAALVSTVRTALRARGRQYETRAHLAALEEADRRKDEFLATLAHELRNPLAPIRNSVQILRLSGAGAAIAQLSEMMDRQVTHMVRLVDDLLEISRITRGKVELRNELTTLNAVIEAAIETSRPLIEAGKHVLRVELPSQPVKLWADAVRLAQVFANLLNNAAKYTEPGGAIAITARCDSDTTVVKVTDSGIGISATLLPHVFDMFAQARDAEGGLGIGLTLVRSLVEMHGGTVQASSEGAGKGSEFTVTLPLARTAHSSEAAQQAVELREIAEPVRVVVVDDNLDAADTLGILLQMLGAQVKIAHDGRDALRACDAHQPAIVFLDLGMPEMDGYEVARRLRCMPCAHDATLVALSGWGQEEDRKRAVAAGFNHHLIKPADLESLQALLATVIDARESATRRSTTDPY